MNTAAGEKELWEKFKAGDKTALADVYFRYSSSMFQYGIRIKEDPDFVKDCIQDVFWKLMQAGKNLKSTDNIRFYLFKALKNTIYKELGKQKKVQFLELNQPGFEGRFELEDLLAEKENASEQETALLNALKNLSERQREIIYLRYESGLEYEAIAEIMDLKMDSARKLVFRAIKALRQAMNNPGDASILFLFGFSNKHVL